MSRRTIQSVCIVLVFLLAVAAVLFLGIRQGKTVSMQVHGVELSEKTPWEEAIKIQETPPADPTVYITENGTKYHVTSDCSALKRAKQVIGTPLSGAEAQGKEPCSLCAEE